MTPGSILLGNASHCFECGHEQATGDPLCRLQLRAGILRSHRRRRGRIDFRATIRNAAAAASERVGAMTVGSFFLPTGIALIIAAWAGRTDRPPAT
jgi:hypothetical protein